MQVNKKHLTAEGAEELLAEDTEERMPGKGALPFRLSENQEKHYDGIRRSSRIGRRIGRLDRRGVFFDLSIVQVSQNQGDVYVGTSRFVF